MKTSTFSDLNRRDFLRVGAVGIAGLTLGVSQMARAAGGKIPIGVQLYSVREQCAKDLPGVLAAISKMGYRGVEWAGYHGRTAKELRTMLDDNGLVTCGTHTAYETILPDKLAETVEFNRTIGNKYLIVPWMTGNTKQEWLDKAKVFNEVAAKLKPENMLTGYHAHAHDFHKLDGERAWDIFFGNTRNDVVMQLDTSNCADGGAEAVEVLKQYPGRAITVHLKANGAGAEAVIGEDKVNWKGVFEFCESKGKTEWYIVEHESSKDPMNAIKRSLESLKKLGKA